MVGKIIDGRYEILSVIGQGGMGIVYLANHLLLQQQVVLKMLRYGAASDEQAPVRFQREARAICSLKHANIVQVSAFCVTEDQACYLVMELIKGLSLAEMIKPDAPLPVDTAIDLFAQLADALGYAHAQGLIHRDVKPSNVLVVSESGKSTAKLIDFGLAKFLPGFGKDIQKLTQTGEVFGSPCYMSPEQCMGQKLDARSDIYSLGCLMYETITGQPVFLEETAAMTMFKHVEGKPTSMLERCDRNDIPLKLDEIVLKTLKKNSGDRLQTMSELHGELIELKAMLPKLARETAKRTERPRKAGLGRREMVMCGVVIVGLCLTVFAAEVTTTFKDKSQAVLHQSQKTARELFREAEDYTTIYQSSLEPKVADTMMSKWKSATDAADAEYKLHHLKPGVTQEIKSYQLMIGQAYVGRLSCGHISADEMGPCLEKAAANLLAAKERRSKDDDNNLWYVLVQLVFSSNRAGDKAKALHFLGLMKPLSGEQHLRLAQIKALQAEIDVETNPRAAVEEARQSLEYYKELSDPPPIAQRQIASVKDTLRRALAGTRRSIEVQGVRTSGKMSK